MANNSQLDNSGAVSVLGVQLPYCPTTGRRAEYCATSTFRHLEWITEEEAEAELVLALSDTTHDDLVKAKSQSEWDQAISRMSDDPQDKVIFKDDADRDLYMLAYEQLAMQRNNIFPIIEATGPHKVLKACPPWWDRVYTIEEDTASSSSTSAEDPIDLTWKDPLSPHSVFADDADVDEARVTSDDFIDSEDEDSDDEDSDDEDSGAASKAPKKNLLIYDTGDSGNEDSFFYVPKNQEGPHIIDGGYEPPPFSDSEAFEPFASAPVAPMPAPVAPFVRRVSTRKRKQPDVLTYSSMATDAHKKTRYE